MRKLFFLLLVLPFGVFAQTETRKPDPIWLSKDIHKMQFRKHEFQFAEVRTSMAGLSISKQVQFVSPNRAYRRGSRVKMTGMPASNISKGAARMQYEKKKKK